MNWTDLLLRLRALVGHRRAEGELDEELSFHIEMEARKNRAAGMPDAQARMDARARFGGVAQVGEECRDVRGVTFLENLARDIHYGARVLRKTPVFTAIAVLSLAVGIGANTAIFSLLDTVLFRMLPVRDPEQLVIVKWGARTRLDLSGFYSTNGGDGQGGWTRNVFSWAIFAEMRSRSRALGDVVGFSPLGSVNIAASGQALSTGAMVASGNYFQALGVSTVVGRTFTEDDDTAGGVASAVISYRLWDRVFARDPSAVGKTLYVNGQPCTVIGVTPKNFFGISAGGFWQMPEVDITLPIRSRARMESSGNRRVAWFGDDDLFWVQAMGRLNPGSEPTARNELAALLMANLAEDDRRALGAEMPRIYLDPGSQGLDNLRSVYRQPLYILMVVVGLTLLMACANLAGLLLARATARQKEIMLRLAVGASRGRLVRQLLVEGALLSASGAIAGLAFAWWGVRALQAMVASGSAPIPVTVSPDARVLGFTAAIALLTTFLFALAPAMRATRVDVAKGLKEDAPAAPGIRRFGAGRILVAIQVAVSLVLLAGATLFTRSLANLRALPLGFNPHNLVLFDIAPGKNGYDETRGNQLYARVAERLKETRGVIGVSLSTERLMRGTTSNAGITIEGAGSRRPVNVNFNFVGPDFFEVMGMSLVMGRGIESRDLAATRVAVISENLARRHFGASPLGKRFRSAFRKEWDVEVVGVVKDAKYQRLRGEPPLIVYFPYTQTSWGWQPQEMTFEVRIANNAPDAIASIRRAVAEIDRMLPLTKMKTQEAQIDDSLAQERLFASLVSLFSAITLVLACVGLYGSVAYTVTRRTRELGVHMALGAGRITVMRMLLGQVTITIVAGLALGLPATWALTRVVESQLYGIKPHDPMSLSAASVAVMGVAILAALLPARRAMRIDPVRALRYE